MLLIIFLPIQNVDLTSHNHVFNFEISEWSYLLKSITKWQMYSFKKYCIRIMMKD